MATVYGLNRDFFGYVADDGNPYQVALTVDDAAAGVFGVPVAIGVYPPLPRGWRMRKIYGKSSTGILTKIPVQDQTGTLWTSGGSFTKHSVSFDCEGKIGEKRTLKS